MKPEPDWDQIQTLFAYALERPPHERIAFLDRACAGDPELRPEVLSLLMSHDRAGAFLADPAFESVDPALPRISIEGTLIGPWRVLQLLGRGGMGLVYLAERADGEYERLVALKVIKRGMDTDAILDRFLKERQILARLAHPGIARFLDAGATADGRPYFVMERIEGTSLIRYCDTHRLGLEERLRLFCDVCRAVQYAHNNLVVHRDLKPSNILVTPDAQVKLLDFGIAKVLGGDGAAEHTALTAEGLRPLTPEYAAPEHLRGWPVTTAADVYSLGAVLYELIAGKPPHRLGKRSAEEALRLIASGEPAPPSRTVEDGQRRSGRRLRGDLDTIVLTALRPEPERRYPTAEALLEDLRRHLSGHPVAARPDTAAYRTSKFVRRHRVGVAVSLLFLATLLGSGVALSLQQRQTARERDRAALEALKARQVTEFLTEIFEVSDPDQARGDSITARALLDRGAERIDAELAVEPEVRAEMLAVLGTTYQKLGLYERAHALLEEALNVRLALHGPRHLDVAQSTAQLAWILNLVGDYERAKELSRSALATRRELLGPEDTIVAHNMTDLADILNARGEFDAAEGLIRAALEINRKHGSAALVASDLNDLSTTLWRRGDYADALPLAEEALALRRAAHGEEHTAVALGLHNLSTLLLHVGELERAEDVAREALAMRRRLLGHAHPDVAFTLNELGMILHHRGRHDEAQAAFNDALAIRRAALPANHPDLAFALNQVGAYLLLGGDAAGAAEHFEEALAIWRPALGDAHPAVLTTLHNLGRVQFREGDLDGAERTMRETIALRRQALGDRHTDVASGYHVLGLILERKGEYDAAEHALQTALATWRGAHGSDHPNVAMALGELGRLLLDRRRFAEAEPLLREALDIRLAHLDEETAEVAIARLHLGRCLLGLRRYAEAEPLLLASLPVLAEQRGEDHRGTRLARRALADLYMAWGRPEVATRYSH